MTTPPEPRVYLINEQHQLPPFKKAGGGRSVKLVNVDWPGKRNARPTNLRRTPCRASPALARCA